ncbi:uncharacterized protein LOC129268704 isoform X2 [Lytechinus pictus]|uniref:uncharacterized protein LOC129268704 isoform X2 n=1 Tax=Lytechinus pictus TaxID=7653 RepID=UPI0030B9F26D
MVIETESDSDTGASEQGLEVEQPVDFINGSPRGNDSETFHGGSESEYDGPVQQGRQNEDINPQDDAESAGESDDGERILGSEEGTDSDVAEGSSDDQQNGDSEEEEIDQQLYSDEGSDMGEHNPDLEEPQNLQIPNGDEVISSDGSDVTKFDSFLAVLAFAMKHHITGVALQDLIDLINLHCPHSLPQSKYLFNNVFHTFKDTCQFHFYCNCMKYLGKRGELPEICDKCGEEIDEDNKVKEGKFFLVFPLADQLQYLLEHTEVGGTIINREIRRTDETISDITDGTMYQELVREGLLCHKDNLSLSWNTDGVPIFRSSKSSMWPVMCTINELPMRMRRENVMLTALWFGEIKPDMSVFLKPFVDECNVLSSTGLQWTHVGVAKTSRVFPLLCTVDSVARPLLQNMIQFNGFYGCPFCKEKGEHAERAMRYPYKDPPAEQRTCEETKMQSVLAAESGILVDGLKGVSVLSFLMYFNIISGFVPDYMHAVCLGVVKKFMHTWLDPVNRNCHYYIGNMKHIINRRIVSLKVSNNISRIPRTLKDINFWKASEWRTFLYISPVILLGILPNRFLAHWTMLVCAIFHLNSRHITNDILRSSDFMLRKFVMYVVPLYGIKESTFNVHLLLHMSNSVKQWGPLWGTSAFPFESYNGYLKKLFSGTNYVPQQIFQSVCRLQDLVRNMPYITSHGAATYVSGMVGGNKIHKKFARFRSGNADVVCLGRARLLDLSQACIHAVQDFLREELLVVTVECFERFIINKILFSTKQYSQNFKRNDSVI